MSIQTGLKAVISVVDRVSKPVRKINRQIGAIGKGFKGVGRSVKGLSSQLSGLFGPAGLLTGAAGVGGLSFGLSKIVQTSAEFERFRTILNRLEGSAEKGGRSMEWVKEFAKTTPYELTQVTDAFVKLRAYGIDPQSGALRAAGDAAAAMGKPLEQAVEALADAMTGENERLKEFGIKAKTVGDQIVYTWNENGKAMRAVANKNSGAQIQSVLEGIWNRRYGGAMDKLSTTWEGMWSNLMDTITQFLNDIGQAGIFDALKTELQGVLDLLAQMAADGRLQEIARTISEVLVAGLRSLKNTLISIDWAATWEGLKGFWTRIEKVVDFVGGWENALIGLVAFMNAGLIASLFSVGQAMVRLGAIFLANPIGLVVAAIAAAALLIYANWDTVGPWFMDLWESMKKTFGGAYDFIAGILTGDMGRSIDGFKSIWDGLTSYWSVLWDGLRAVLEYFGVDVEGFFARIDGLINGFLDRLNMVREAITDNVITNGIGDGLDAVGDGWNSLFGDDEATKPGLIATGGAAVSGALDVNFNNAPAGMRVSGGETNQKGLALNPNVGYRRHAYMGG